MMARVFILGIVAMVAIGCDARPQYGWDTGRGTPGVHAEYGRFKADANANGTFHARGVDAGGGMFNRHFKADEITMAPDVTPQWNGVLGGMSSFERQQVNYWTGINAMTKTIMDGIPPIITSATPLLGPWLNAMGQAKIASQTRPSILQSLADLVKSGGTTIPVIDGAFKAIDPNLAPDVANLLGGIKPLSAAQPRNPIDPQTLNSIGKPRPATTLPPRQAADALLTPAELPVLPSRDDVRREFALSEVVQAGLPEMELVRFK